MELYLKYFGSKEEQRKDLTPYYFLQLKETREKLRKIGLFKPEDTFGEFLDTVGSKTFQDKVDIKRYDSPYYFLGRRKAEETSQVVSRQPSPDRNDASDLGGAGMPPMMQQDNLEAQERRASQLVQEMYGNIFKGLNNPSENEEDDDEESDNTSDDRMIRANK